MPDVAAAADPARWVILRRGGSSPPDAMVKYAFRQTCFFKTRRRPDAPLEANRRVGDITVGRDKSFPDRGDTICQTR